MDWRVGIKQVEYAYEQKYERMLWEQWLMAFPYMEEKKSFNDYKESFKPKQKLKSNDKKRIDDKVERINKMMQKGR